MKITIVNGSINTCSTYQRSSVSLPISLLPSSTYLTCGPNTGVFVQITADDTKDLAVPGQTASFGIIKAAQARGDFDVLTERDRRALRLHIKGDVSKGLAAINTAVAKALS